MAAHQAPLSLGFSRQENWNGLPFPSPMHARMLSRFSHVRLYATLCTAASQDPLSMGFSRQEYWSGSPCPPPGDRPNPGTDHKPGHRKFWKVLQIVERIHQDLCFYSLLINLWRLGRYSGFNVIYFPYISLQFLSVWTKMISLKCSRSKIP